MHAWIRKLIATFVVLMVVGQIAVVPSSASPVSATDTQIATDTITVVPVSQSGSVIGFDVSAEGKVVAPIRLSSNGLITATSAAITKSGISRTLTITGLRCKPGAGVEFASSDFVSVSITQGAKYPVVRFRLTLVKFDAAAWKAVAGNCPFHFLSCSIPDATIWQQRGWGMATPKLDPFTLKLDQRLDGTRQVATKYNRDWSYVVPMGAAFVPVIGLWEPEASHYVGFLFQGARLLDHSERYVCASYCWKQGIDNQFVTLAYPYGGTGYQDLVYPQAGDSVSSWFDLLWSWDMPAWKEPNELCQDFSFSKYQASLPAVPAQNDLAYVPGGIQRELEQFTPSDVSRKLSWFVSTADEDQYSGSGFLSVASWGLYAQDNIQAAYNTGDTAAIKMLRNDVLSLLQESEWVTMGGERCLVWSEPIKGSWKPGFTPGNENEHTMDWWAIGNYMVDFYRNDHDTSWLPWIDGLYNWSRQYLYTRDDFHDVPSSPFAMASSLVCPFLVDYYETFHTDPARQAKAEDALEMSRSYMYRYLITYLGDNDPNDSLDSSFLMEPNSGMGWAGAACANETSWTIDTIALAYVNSGDAQIKYYLRGILERFYELYKDETMPVVSIGGYDHSSFAECFGLFDGCIITKGKRATYGICEALRFCFPIGQSSMRVLCGPKAAISFDKNGTSSDISSYRCDPGGGFSFRVASSIGKPFDVSATYPLRDVHAMSVTRTRGGITSALVQGRDYETHADSPANIMLHDVQNGDVIMVGDASKALACNLAPVGPSERRLASVQLAGNYQMVPLPTAASVSIAWTNNDSFAGILPGQHIAWGVPYFLQPSTAASPRIASTGSIVLSSPITGATDIYVVYSPDTAGDQITLKLAGGKSVAVPDEQVSVWNSWPKSFHQQIVMSHVSIAAGDTIVRLDAGQNLVFAFTASIGITASHQVMYDNGVADALSTRTEQQFFAAASDAVNARIGDRRIALIPPAYDSNFSRYRMGGLVQRTDVLTEEQLIDPLVFNAATYPVAMYTGGEDYIRTVATSGDGAETMQRYLSQGGVLVFAAETGLGTFPMYYGIDGNASPVPDPLLPQLGISIYGPWESPPGPLTVRLSAGQNIITGLPASFAFPSEGDLRLRPLDPAQVSSDVKITPILTIDGLGDAAFLAEFVSGPMKGGKILYVWGTFFRQYYADALYDGVIRFIANQYIAAP